MPVLLSSYVTKFLTLITLATLLFFSQFSLSSATAPLFSGCTAAIVAPTNTAWEREVTELVNLRRAENDLPPLKLIDDLSNASRYHAADMQQDDYFEHDSYDHNGDTPQFVCKWYKRIENYYSGGTLGENIAYGYGSPTAVMNGWMNSPGHRSNILNSKFWELGVGFYAGYWGQDFGRRSGIYPVIINGEAGKTSSTAVQLYIYGTTWSEMRLRNDDGAWSAWQPFSNTVAWTLANASGLRSVSVEMRSSNASASNSDTIKLVLGGAEPTATPTATATPIATQPALVGNITLQGRPAPPHSSWSLPLQVEFARVNSAEPAQLFTAVSDTQGNFTIPNPLQGEVRIAVKGDHTLRRVVTTTIDNNGAQVNFGELVEGDIVADDLINLLDFSALAAHFTTCTGSADFSAQSDLNHDGCTNQADLTLLRDNFGVQSDPWLNAGLSASAVAHNSINADSVNADIEIAQINQQKVGDKIMLTVQIAGEFSNTINAGAIYLNFDPTQLKALAINPTSPFQIALATHIDNLTGKVDLAAGMLSKGIKPPFAAAVVVFEATANIESTTVSLSIDGDRRTDLAGNGQSLFPDPQRSGLHFESEQSSFNEVVYLPLVQR